jgi:WD40 repeat protein
MLLKRYFSAVCIGFVCLVQPAGAAKPTPRDNLVAVALTPNQIKAKASRFVVRIDGQGKDEKTGNILKDYGSGFIVNKNGNIYTVLTAAHVANNSIGKRSIITPDGKSHSFTVGNVRILSSKIDLAEITFISNETYEVAKFRSNNIPLESKVFVYGWNAIDEDRASYSARLPRFPQGTLDQEQPIENNQNGGYTLVLGMVVVPGLSGSPILDEDGEVIGVYGKGDTYGSAFGISIATYQRYTSVPRPMPVSPIDTSVRSTNTNRLIPVIPTPQARDTNPKPRSNNFSLAYSLSADQGTLDSLEISPNGKTLVSGGANIKVWGLGDGRLIHTLDHQDRVGSVIISPNGQTLVSGGWGKANIKVWGLEDGKLIRTFRGHENWIPSIAFSPDGQTIVSGSGDNTIKIWRFRDLKLLHTLRGHQKWVRLSVISPDGQTIVSGSGDNTIKIWRLQDGKLLRTLKGHQSWVRSLAISPDGKTLVSGGGDNKVFGQGGDNTIKIWRLQDGKLLSTFSGHSDGVISLAIFPDGQTLVSASEDNTIKVWRLQDRQLLHTLSSHKGRVTSLAISPDGQTLVSGSWDNTIKVWQVNP